MSLAVWSPVHSYAILHAPLGESLMRGWCVPNSDGFEADEARGKVFLIGLSAHASVGYCLLCLLWIPGRQQPGPWFWIVWGTALGIMILGSVDWQTNKFVTGLVPIPDLIIREERYLISGAVYLTTLMYVLLIAGLCYYTGGPVSSPYATILLTIAVLSPFVTKEDTNVPMTVVLLYVVAAYCFSWWLSDVSNQPKPNIPDGLVVLTSIVSVVIALGLEAGKRIVNKRAAASATSTDQKDRPQ